VTAMNNEPRDRDLTQYNLQMSVWNQGAQAAREGKPATANPINPLRYEFVSWHNGWSFATHLIAKEKDDF
jgi:hypothetical protein